MMKKVLQMQGQTLIPSGIYGPRNIPEGTYDIGDGFYDATQNLIFKYNGEFKRDLEIGEEKWIIEKAFLQPMTSRRKSEELP